MGTYNYQVKGWPASPRSQKRKEMNIASGGSVSPSSGGVGGSDVDLSGYVRIADLIKTITEAGAVEFLDTNVMSALYAKTLIDGKANTTHDHRGQLIRPSVMVIPQQSPSDAGFELEEGEAAMYINPSGNYAVAPSGGVANVYPLTLRINGVETVFNPGTRAETVTITIPTALSSLDADSAHRLVTDTQITGWNGKYALPQGGIPKTDLASAVQSSLDKADTALQSHQSLSGYATENWVNGRGFLTDVDLSAFSEGITSNSARISSLEDTLREWDIADYVASWALALTKPSYTLDEVPDGTTRKLSSYVPVTRKVNNKALSADITLTLDDISDGNSRKLANYVTLAGAQEISGVKTFSAQPKFTAANMSPFTVSSSVAVTNLNADLLDGAHKGDLLTSFTGGGLSSSGNSLTRAKLSLVVGGTTKEIDAASANIINSLSVSRLEQTSEKDLRVSITVNGQVSAVAEIAELSVSSARRLSGQSAYTAWGQEYWANGVPKSISGALTNVTDITGSGKITIPHAKFADSLSVPQSAPNNPESGEAYFYVSSDGEYGQTPSGGVSNVYPLTLRINGVETVFNPGTRAETVTITIPTALSSLDADSAHRLVTDTQITGWNGKYALPQGGIPKTDLASAVQSSLDKADTALQSHQSLSGYATENWVNGRGFLTDVDLSAFSEGITSNSARISSLEDTLREWDIADYVASWALALTKPSYTLDEVPDGTTRKLSSYVPVTRKVNNKALSADITLTLDDVSDGNSRKLANYLLLSGGTMSGDIVFNSKTADKAIRFIKTGDTSQRALLMTTSGSVCVGYDLPSNNLPLYLDGYDIYVRYGANKTYSVRFNSSGSITGLQTILPASNNTSNIGEVSQRFKDMYLSGKATIATAEIEAALIVPTSPPSNPETGKAYLYINPNGNYGVQPSSS